MILLHKLANTISMALIYTHDLKRATSVSARIDLITEKLPPYKIASLMEIRSIDPKIIEHRFANADSCYVAWAGTKMAHFIWVQDRGPHFIHPAGITHHIQKGELWIYDAETKQDFRGLSIYPYMLSLLLRRAKENGYVRAVIYTNRNNSASIRGIQKSGFVLDASLFSLHIGSTIIPLPSYEYFRNGIFRREFIMDLKRSLRKLSKTFKRA
jgi:RimJ/RimL family protein N-acetyltransferase